MMTLPKFTPPSVPFVVEEFDFGGRSLTVDLEANYHRGERAPRSSSRYGSSRPLTNRMPIGGRRSPRLTSSAWPSNTTRRSCGGSSGIVRNLRRTTRAARGRMKGTDMSGNESAFPYYDLANGDKGLAIDGDQRGMTLRAWLAGQALAGLASQTDETEFICKGWSDTDSGLKNECVADIAFAAVQLADAVIAELNKEKTK